VGVRKRVGLRGDGRACGVLSLRRRATAGLERGNREPPWRYGFRRQPARRPMLSILTAACCLLLRCLLCRRALPARSMSRGPRSTGTTSRLRCSGGTCVCVCVCVCARARVACLLAPAAPLLAQSAVAVPILYSPVCVVAHALDEVCAREFTHGSAQGSRGL
jgi:hypothetical protein